jgi:Tfp pilus assembly PilM family ATPase
VQALPSDVEGLIANHAEALASEISASFEYAAHQYHDAAVANLYLCGTGACVNGLDKHLKTHLSMPTTALRPVQVYPGIQKRQLQCTTPELIAALGLAMFPMQALEQKVKQAV